MNLLKVDLVKKLDFLKDSIKNNRCIYLNVRILFRWQGFDFYTDIDTMDVYISICIYVNISIIT